MVGPRTKIQLLDSILFGGRMSIPENGHPVMGGPDYERVFLAWRLPRKGRPSPSLPGCRTTANRRHC